MQVMLNVLMVGLFGALGAICRFTVHHGCRKWFQEEHFPLAPLIGTLSVNILGCFLLGLLWNWPELRNWPHLKHGLASGFLGALTTFSTFGAETVSEMEKGEWFNAFGNITLNVGVGLLAVWMGFIVGRFFFPAELSVS